jgi:hypothetical protein
VALTDVGIFYISSFLLFCFSVSKRERNIYKEKKKVLHSIVLVRLLVWTSAVKETLVEKYLEAELSRQAVY